VNTKTSLKIPILSDDDDDDYYYYDDDDDLQDTNFYAETNIVNWDMLISGYDIGSSFRIF